VYDNSPENSRINLPEQWFYSHNPLNGGVSAAYNFALDRAKELGCDWLVLLDQDTSLPPDFFSSLLAILDGPLITTDVVAIVPRVFSGGRQSSPVYPAILRSTPCLVYDKAMSDWIMSINSGSAIRVEFLDSIGGFTNELWLDFLDHWLFLKIHQSGKKTFVSDIRVQHSLSITDFDRSMKTERYENILDAEIYFTNEYLPLAWRMALPFRFMARAAKHLLATKSKAYSWMMARAAFRQALSIARAASGGDVPSQTG
jgi:GT2 family glycosyltransferase